jgi:integrase
MKDEHRDHRRELENLIRGIQGSDLSEENKNDLLRFHENNVAMGLKVSTQHSQLHNLYAICKLYRKTLRDANKDGVVQVVRLIEEQDWRDSYKKILKIVLKKFYKWVRQTRGYPEEVEWIRLGKRTGRILPEDLLTVEEVEVMAKAAKNPRDRALVLALASSGCRIGEILSLRIKNIQFDSLGCVLLVNGKTGQKRVRMLEREHVRALVDWLDKHPLKDDPEAPVWVNLGNRARYEPIGYNSVKFMLKELAVRIGMGRWADSKKRRYIGKKVNPHNFRHTLASVYAQKLPNAIMNEHFGWVQNSEMPSVYYHISGKNVDDALLKAHGLKPTDEEVKPVTNRVYSNCGEINSVLSHFCKKCNAFLDLSLAWKEKDEAVARVLEELKQDGWFVKRIKKIIKDLRMEKEFEEV